MPTNNWKLGLGLASITAVLWGLLPIALKALLEQMDVFTINWYRFLVAAVLLSAILLFRGEIELSSLKKPTNLILILIAIAGLLGNYIAYVIGLQTTTAGGTVVLIQLANMLLLIGSLVIFKEHFSARQYAGVIIFFTGLGLFFNIRIAEMFGGINDYLLGLLWVVLAAVVWAAYALAQKALLRDMRSQHILLLIYISGALVFIPGASPSSALQLDAEGIFLLLFVCLNTVIAYGAFAEAMVHWQASKVSVTTSMAPLLTLLFVGLINGVIPNYSPSEPMNSWAYLGAVLVVTGSIAAVLPSRRKSPAPLKKLP